MRILVFCLSFFLFLTATIHLRAQDPGAQQDAEAAREKLLKAEDQLENIQNNSETTKTAVDGMKTDVSKLQADVLQLQTDNASLKQQLADLQAAFAKAEAAHAKERQVLIDSVADLIKQSGASKSSTKKKPEKPVTEPATPAPVKTPDAESSAAPAASTSGEALSPPADTPPAASAPPADTPPPKPQKGYYHIVASGETLRLICNAYRQDGVNVSVSDIQKANGLTDKSILKVGQKLFIPKPGT